MTAGHAIVTALTFVWLGMILAISFMETPLKFRAPGVTRQIGLGIGRLVFRALNIAEGVLAVVIAAAILLDPPSPTITGTYALVLAVFAVQLLVVRPLLRRRSSKVLAGLQAPRSRGHYAYVGLESAKLLLLVLGGTLLLAGT